jgi:hypothetical protein
MPSNRTPTRFYGPAILSSSTTVLYTVPANKIAVIKLITAYAGGTEEVQIGLNGTAQEDIIHRESLAEFQTIDRWKYVVAVEAETIDGRSSDDNLTVTIDGDLYDE